MHHVFAALATALALAACTRADERAPAPAPDLAARGAQLVALGGCGDCHTPLAFDPEKHAPVPMAGRLLSGHPENGPEPKGTPGDGDQAVIGGSMTSFRTPFGVVYTANLTPDVETGIGGWTEAEFVGAMRRGKHRGSGRPILPPMPWQNLAHASDDDLRAIYTYLRTLPPVKNRVPEPAVPAAVLASFGARPPSEVAQ